MEVPFKRRGCPPGGWPSQIAKRNALAASHIAPKSEQERVVASKEFLPRPIEATTFSFALEHVGQNLWRVVMLRHSGDKILERKYVSHGDLKGNALARLRFMVYQLWFNETMPKEDVELVPSQPAMHG